MSVYDHTAQLQRSTCKSSPPASAQDRYLLVPMKCFLMEQASHAGSPQHLMAGTACATRPREHCPTQFPNRLWRKPRSGTHYLLTLGDIQDRYTLKGLRKTLGLGALLNNSSSSMQTGHPCSFTDECWTCLLWLNLFW